MATIIPIGGVYPRRVMPTFQEILNDEKYDGRLGTGIVGEYVSDGLKKFKGIFKKKKRGEDDIPAPPAPGGHFATYVDPRISRAARNYSSEAVDRLAYGLAAYDALMKNQKIEHLPPEEMVRRYRNAEGFEEGDTNYIGTGSLRDMLVRLVHESKAKHLRKKRGVSHYDVHPEVVAAQEADAATYRSEAHDLIRQLFK